MDNLGRDELKGIVSDALSPLEKTVELKFQFLGQKVDEVRQAQGQMYSKEAVNEKMGALQKEVGELSERVKNIWPQALACGGGLWLFLQAITWIAAHAPK